MTDITARVAQIKNELKNGNAYGEKITLVAATKMQTVESINEAIQAGVDAVAENKVQEFRDKNHLLLPCPKHFIGHLQTNKVKYLVGSVDLFHSCDRDALAEELATQSLKKGMVSSVLMQINVSGELSKGGYALSDARSAFLKLCAMEGIKVRGLMTMLPETEDVALLTSLMKKTRALYDALRGETDGIDYLSVGMSGDYRICVDNGSNTVRIGSTIFGRRVY